MCRRPLASSFQTSCGRPACDLGDPWRDPRIWRFLLDESSVPSTAGSTLAAPPAGTRPSLEGSSLSNKPWYQPFGQGDVAKKCPLTGALTQKRLLQARNRFSGSPALALRLALRIGMLAAQQNRETLDILQSRVEWTFGVRSTETIGTDARVHTRSNVMTV